MSVADISDPKAVRSAIAEFDQIGRKAFLERYGFGKATKFYVRHARRDYDSKAILGVAHMYQFGKALTPYDFSGGNQTNGKLGQLGFKIVRAGSNDPAADDPEADVEDLIRGRRGQSFGLSAAQRFAVERRAMDVIAAIYRAEGWTLVDVSKNTPFDWLATRGGEELHIEVKGTTSDEGSVLLTKNEVASARHDPGHAMLAVVSDIVLDSSPASPVASGGRLITVHPWHIADGALTPLAFRYDVPLKKAKTYN
jgi:uncharacterized protein DUF3883